MFIRACPVFVVLILQGLTLSAAYQVETEDTAPTYLDAASVNYRDDGSQYIVFDVKSCKEVVINLLNVESPEIFRITLRPRPYESVIALCHESSCPAQQKSKLNLNFCSESASFWISFSASEIKFGSGCEVDNATLLAATPTFVFALQKAGVSSKQTASWKVGESSACAAKTPTTAPPTTTTTSPTTDSGQESTSSKTDYQSSTATKEETKAETTTPPKDKVSPQDKAKSSAPFGSTVQIWIIPLAVLTISVRG